MVAEGEPIWVVAIGSSAPVGLNARMVGASIAAGIRRCEEHPFMLDAAYDPVVVAMSPLVEATAPGSARHQVLALAALTECIGPLAGIALNRMSLCLGLASPTFSQETGPAVERELKDSWPAWSLVQHLPRPIGPLAGLEAIATSFEALRTGTRHLCLAGSVDSLVHPRSIMALATAGKLKSAENRWGIIPSEAAAFLALARADHARQMGLKPLARIHAVKMTHHSQGLRPYGETLGPVFTALVEGFNGKIRHVLADLTGERWRSEEFGFASACRTDYLLEPSEFLTPAEGWGYPGSAHAPLMANLAITLSVPGDISLVWCLDEDGACGALLIERLS